MYIPTESNVNSLKHSRIPAVEKYKYPWESGFKVQWKHYKYGSGWINNPRILEICTTIRYD